MIEFTHRITSGLSFFLSLFWRCWTWIWTPIRMSRARALTLGGLLAVLFVWVGLVGASPCIHAGARGHLLHCCDRVPRWSGGMHLARIHSRAPGACRCAAAVAFTVIEAALGAFLVKLGLTAQSRSPLRAPYLALHLTNTLLLLAALTLAAHFLGRHIGFMRDKVRIDRAVCRHCVARDRARGRRYRISGRTGRHPVPGELAGRRVRARFLPHERVARALALDASRPSRFWPASSSSGCWCAPRSAGRTGTTARSPRWC